MKHFKWQRFGGYECSSKGDSRFSAFNAILKDGRSIEMHYQCDVKGYDIGGTNWRLGKGKKPLKDIDSYAEYLKLWKEWSNDNLNLMRILYKQAVQNDCVLSDRFATSDVNQARALVDVLNELCNISGNKS